MICVNKGDVPDLQTALFYSLVHVRSEECPESFHLWNTVENERDKKSNTLHVLSCLSALLGWDLQVKNSYPHSDPQTAVLHSWARSDNTAAEASLSYVLKCMSSLKRRVLSHVLFNSLRPWVRNWTTGRMHVCLESLRKITAALRMNIQSHNAFKNWAHDITNKTKWVRK